MTDFEPIDDGTRPGCETGSEALQRFFDGEAAWDSSAAFAHRRTCIDCRDELALARHVVAVPNVAAIVPSDLSHRLLKGAIADHRRRRFSRFAGAGFALAASIVAVVIVTYSPANVFGPKQTVEVVSAKPPAVNKPLGETVSEARDAVVALTLRTANETRDSSAWSLALPKRPAGPVIPDGLDPLADAQAGAARSVEPLASSARRAVNLFLRAADPPARPTVQ